MLALHVDDVAAARAELEAKGIAFAGETIDSSVCHMAPFNDPDGNSLMLHHRYTPYENGRPMARTELLERYQALPLPTTRDEAWRFTDLKGFDPDSFGHARGQTPEMSPAPMLDLAVSGLVTVTEARHRDRACAEGITFEPLADHPRLHELVGWDEKFAAHNAALWQNGLLVVVPRDMVLDEPLYVRIANSTDGGSLFWRLLVVAEAGSRFTLIEEYASRASGRRRLLERRRRAVRRGRREARVRLAAEPLAADVALRFASRARRARRRARLGRRRLRLEEGQDPHPERPSGPGRGLAGDGRLLRRRDAASRLRHVPGAHGAEHPSDFKFKGALRDEASTVWRGMIRVERDAQKTNAYQEYRNLLLSKSAHADSIPGLEILANDVRCTHGATLGQVDREQLFYLMARGLPRAEAERLIVRGFFQDVLDRIELEPVREALGDALEARIPQAVVSAREPGVGLQCALRSLEPRVVLAFAAAGCGERGSSEVDPVASGRRPDARQADGPLRHASGKVQQRMDGLQRLRPVQRARRGDERGDDLLPGPDGRPDRNALPDALPGGVRGV